MTWFLYGEDESIKNWIIDKIDYVHKLDPCVTIGVISGDRLIAGVAYHDYHSRYGVIQMSIATISSMWAKRSTISRLLRYPFEQLNCYKVMISIRTDNIKALKTFEKVGFEHEAVLQHNYGEGQHAVIMRMLRPDYIRLFGVDDGKRFSRSTTAC